MTAMVKQAHPSTCCWVVLREGGPQVQLLRKVDHMMLETLLLIGRSPTYTTTAVGGWNGNAETQHRLRSCCMC